MNLFGMMDASGEAMQAERVRAEVVAANMANAETTRTATGGPYRRQHVVFAADSGDTKFLDSISGATGGANGGISPGTGLVSSGATFLDSTPSALGSAGGVAVAPGVHIAGVVEDPSPPLRRYDPGIPMRGRMAT